MPNALSGYTPGSPLINYREIQYGSFIFPLTMQEQTRLTKLKSQRQIIPYLTGEYISPVTNVGAREITLVGAMGSGLVGTNSNTLVSAVDLEKERSILAALQVLGRQQLFVTSDRYCNAFMDSFEHKFMQDGGVFRYADWTIKFIADDPRYFSTLQTTITDPARTSSSQLFYYFQGASGGTQPTAGGITQLGSTRAFPIFKFTGVCTNPHFEVDYYSAGTLQGVIGVTFTLSMAAGDTLVIDTDPRPDHRANAVIYTPSGGSPVNGLKYIAPATGFANNYDARYVFPFLEPTGSNVNLVVYSQTNTSPNYTFSMTYNDTWL